MLCYVCRPPTHLARLPLYVSPSIAISLSFCLSLPASECLFLPPPLPLLSSGFLCVCVHYICHLLSLSVSLSPSIYPRPANPDTGTPVRLAIQHKPVRKPVRNLRRMFHGTIMQISIMKTLTKHQFAGNKSFIFFMVCDTVCYRAMSIRQKIALLEFTGFHCKTVVVVVCFFRLFSAVLKKCRH